MDNIQGRDRNGDFTSQVFGTLEVTGKIETPSNIRFQLRCQTCGATGQTVTQAELAAGVTPKCKNSGCGVTSTETRRTAQFGTQDVFRGSVRARREAHAEAEVLKQLEQEESSNV